MLTIVVQGDTQGVHPTPAKIAKKAENQSKECPIDTILGKSGASTNHSKLNRDEVQAMSRNLRI